MFRQCEHVVRRVWKFSRSLCTGSASTYVRNHGNCVAESADTFKYFKGLTGNAPYSGGAITCTPEDVVSNHVR